jgi:hypothetical protein
VALDRVRFLGDLDEAEVGIDAKLGGDPSHERDGGADVRAALEVEDFDPQKVLAWAGEPRTLPRLGELDAVEEGERNRRKEEHELVERPRNGQQAECDEPSKPARDALVGGSEPDRTERPREEREQATHGP